MFLRLFLLTVFRLATTEFISSIATYYEPYSVLSFTPNYLYVCRFADVCFHFLILYNVALYRVRGQMYLCRMCWLYRYIRIFVHTNVNISLTRMLQMGLKGLKGITTIRCSI